MKKTLSKILIILIITSFFICIVANTNNVYATSGGNPFDAEIESLNGEQGDENLNKDVGDLVNKIVVITQIVGVGVAFIIISVLAMKYMTAAPGDKADIKKSAGVYLIGALIVFAVPQILKLLIMLASVFNG